MANCSGPGRSCQTVGVLVCIPLSLIIMSCLPPSSMAIMFLQSKFGNGFHERPRSFDSRTRCLLRHINNRCVCVWIYAKLLRHSPSLM